MWGIGVSSGHPAAMAYNAASTCSVDCNSWVGMCNRIDTALAYWSDDVKQNGLPPAPFVHMTQAPSDIYQRHTHCLCLGLCPLLAGDPMLTTYDWFGGIRQYDVYNTPSMWLGKWHGCWHSTSLCLATIAALYVLDEACKACYTSSLGTISGRAAWCHMDGHCIAR